MELLEGGKPEQTAEQVAREAATGEQPRKRNGRFGRFVSGLGSSGTEYVKEKWRERQEAKEAKERLWREHEEKTFPWEHERELYTPRERRERVKSSIRTSRHDEEVKRRAMEAGIPLEQTTRERRKITGYDPETGRRVEYYDYEEVSHPKSTAQLEQEIAAQGVFMESIRARGEEVAKYRQELNPSRSRRVGSAITAGAILGSHILGQATKSPAMRPTGRGSKGGVTPMGVRGGVAGGNLYTPRVPIMGLHVPSPSSGRGLGILRQTTMPGQGLGNLRQAALPRFGPGPGFPFGSTGPASPVHQAPQSPPSQFRGPSIRRRKPNTYNRQLNRMRRGIFRY